ncbi:peptidylprolyl isomerase [Tellurirhabdus bombi]|uniref:peptidylprolyl isomerase n=1 Tax=Tellurirhabdus bombi TaxID=2907205 RepID=UPI001F1D6D78|nr:peptidylprolyl isomerase [Tellurirhabdus bombi]
MRLESPRSALTPTSPFVLKFAFLSLLLSALLTGCKSSTATKTATPSEPVILKLGNKTFTTDEFFQSFTKNQISADSSRRTDIREYFDLYTNLKLKVLAAEQEGRDTTEAFREELATYRKQLGQSYLNDKALVESLTSEAYQRLQEEVNASHLLITVPEDAAPADTLAAYNTIIDLRKRALAGEDFAALARQYSKDPTAATNGGNLGYLSVFQLTYPLESAAYNTPNGSISAPVRARAGYHLMKVNSRRPNRGRARVAHILVRITPGAGDEGQQAAQKRIDEVYSRLQKGESFDNLAREYSDDKDSRNTGGVLPVIAIGGRRWAEPFEDAVFGLTTPGSYSKPIQTQYGWHIVRLLERIPTESYEALMPMLRQKVVTDTRGEVIREALAQRLRTQYTVTESGDVLKKVLNLADSSLTQGRWKIPALDATVDRKTIVQVNKQAYTTNEFLDYVSRHQQPRPVGSVAGVTMQRLYRKFVDDKLVEQEEKNLENKYPEFRALMTDIRDGVLLSQVMETNVWDKSMADSLAQRQLWEQNKNKYQYDQRAIATVLVAADNESLQQASEMLAKRPYQLRRSVAELGFDANQTALTSKSREGLFDLLVILIKNPDYVVEVAGSADGAERDTVSAGRIRNVVNYLTANGVPLARIMEKDHGKFRPGVKGEKARRITFRLFSNSRADVAKVLTAKNPATLTLQEGIFTKGQNPYVDGVEWKTGNATLQRDGKFALVMIERIEPPRQKTFEEARGAVINDYQVVLEKQLLSRLRQQFPVQANDEEVRKLVK